MRTLNRPMFNMGGPIKQGIMHGIREPYRGGGAALVGNPVYPQTGGREHHAAVKEVIKRSGPIFQRVGNIFKGAPSKVTPKYPQTYTGKEYIPAPLTKMEQIKNWFGSAPAGKYLKGTPEAGIIKGLYEGKGMITKPIKWTATQAAKSPLVMAGLTYTGGKWLFGDGTEATDDQIKNIMKPGGYPGADKKTTKEAQDAFAKTQRDTRVNRYLQLMGYDRAKKTAIADALIDASKIVSDRVTLDRKNITGELINPAIQALSKRLDKPDQIREAVGLMMLKGEIQKDLEDPQVKKLRALEIETKEKLLGENFETDMRNLLLSRKDKVNKKTLEQYARLTADKYGEPFTQVTEDTDLSTLDNGIYMSEDKIIRVTDGVPKRIV